MVVIPSACTTTTTALDAGGAPDRPEFSDVARIDATDTSQVYVNPPPPRDVLGFDLVVPRSDVVDVADTLAFSENPPFPGDALDAGGVDPPDAPPVDVFDGSAQPEVSTAPDVLAADATPPDSGCPAGQRFCDGRCVDVGPHANACTPCGLPCCAGGFCAGGRCTVGCAAGTYVCPSPNPSPRCEGGICVDLRFDANNCGACGRRCPAGQRCAQGACTP